MSNICFNRVTVCGQSEQEILHFMKAVSGPNGAIDFEVIAPVPDLLNNLATGSKSFLANGKKVSVTRWYRKYDEHGVVCEERLLTAEELDELDDIGSECSRDWKDSNWGCTWNADGIEVNQYGTFVEFKFETPWCPPEPIIDLLRYKFLGLNITAFYDEPLMMIGGYY